MTQIFTEQDKASAFGLKRRLLTVYICIAAVALAINAASLTLFFVRLLPRAGATAINIAASALFGCYSLYFFSLRFRLVNAYCKTFRNIERGLKEQARGTFVRIDDTIISRDGVEYYSMILSEFVGKLGMIDTERRALIEKTKPLPDIVEGASVLLITHGGILLSYEVINK